MTMYEYYDMQQKVCELKAELLKNEPKLKQFYKNAAAGFEIKKTN